MPVCDRCGGHFRLLYPLPQEKDKSVCRRCFRTKTGVSPEVCRAQPVTRKETI